LSAERVQLMSVPRGATLQAGSLDAWLERELERARAGAHAAGVAEGRAQALSEAAGALASAAERLDTQREQARAELSTVAIDLGLAIAAQLTLSECAAGRHAVERIVRETLAVSGVGRGTCAVHLHPLDAQALAGVSFRAGTSVVPDAGVERGCVQLATPQGLLVRDPTEALSEIAQKLREELLR
jgi:flagellar biosynthesis/type III secretory pathway protein FliH